MTTSPLALLAAQEYRRRKRSADAAVAGGQYDRGKAERLLHCWLMIALHAGARPSDLPGVDRWQGSLADHYARFLLIEDGPPREEWLAELTRARNAAGTKARAARPGSGDEAAAGQDFIDLSARHHGLDCLCIHLGGESEFARETEREAA